jgi:hypothetical protein
MSELISGKEALIALANGEEVQFCDHMGVWHNAGIHTHAIGLFLNDCYEFRLKPRTIAINGVEVPAPFEPKLDDVVYYLTTTKNEGYTWGHFHPSDAQMTQFGAWRTEAQIKQVVAALRSVFKTI